MAKIQLKLKKITKRKKVKRWCLKDLGSKQELFQEELRKEMASVCDLGKEDIEEHWLKLRETINKGAKEAFGFEKANTLKKSWITERTLEKIEERRKWTNINTD